MARNVWTTFLFFTFFFIKNMASVSMVDFGSSYPVTASWFQDRFTSSEWNSTLSHFSSLGGDTVLLRAPSIVLTTAEELAVDPDFKWCGKDCNVGAVTELSALGLEVVQFGKYQYEEEFDDRTIIQCPRYEKKIVSSRIYYRLVLPLEVGHLNGSCNLNGSLVMVLLTSFSGIDPHALLLDNARDHNMSVYFGIPKPSLSFSNGSLEEVNMVSYFEFVRRIILDHKLRFSDNHENKTVGDRYSILKGYSYSNDFRLTDVNDIHSDVLGTFKQLASFIHSNEKQLVVSTYFQSNRYGQNSSISEYILAFQRLAATNAVDVISVKDGRGSGNGGFFWETQSNTPIMSVDRDLHRILKNTYPFISDNATFNDVFWTSIHEMFYSLADSRDELSRLGSTLELWLNIEAYEFLNDDPCLPIDRHGSGMDQMLNRITKSQLDWSLTHGGVFVQKIAAFAWDPCFTCRTKNHSSTLANQIRADIDRPIIANCSFHSYFNRSVVVIGYNLIAETQAFTVNWPKSNGHRVSSQVHGYYFELDWGTEHHRVPSLMYTQLYDPYYNALDLAPKGYVSVSAGGGYHGCAFKYDFTRSDTGINDSNETVKKYYYSEKTPRDRVFGQNRPRKWMSNTVDSGDTNRT